MPRNNPARAYRRYFDALQAAVGCITHGRLVGRFAVPPQLNRLYALVLNDGDPVLLDSTPRIAFSAGQLFRVIRDPNTEHGSYRATTVEYWYQFALPDRTELLAYHWTPETTDPDQRRFPHLHVGSALIDSHGPYAPDIFSKYHIPTERVSLESVVRFAIEELKVRPVHDHWDEVLSAGQETFNRHRHHGNLPQDYEDG